MRRPRLASPALLAVSGLAGGLLMVEAILRLAPTWLPSDTWPQLALKIGPMGSLTPRFFAEYSRLWEPDDWLREHMKPGVDVVLHGNAEYPEWHIQTGSLGMGSAGFRDTLPAGDPYAVVLGDSFGFGVGVAHDETWMELLEKETGLAFVNLSQVGASSMHEARIYSRYGSRLAARVVLWMYFENDLKENLRFADWLNPQAGIPLAVSLPTERCTSPLHAALKRFSVIYELYLYDRRACEYSAVPAAPVYRDAGLNLQFCGDHDICNLPVQDRMLSDGWPLTRQALLDTRANAAHAGAELVIVIVPSKEAVYWEQYRAVTPVPAGDGADRLTEPLLGLCVAEAIPCIDMTDAFRERAAAPEQLYFPVDIHWNAAGQQLAAQVIGGYLRDAGLMP